MVFKNCSTVRLIWVMGVVILSTCSQMQFLLKHPGKNVTGGCSRVIEHRSVTFQ